jgi:hypothetical protein
LLLFGIYLVVVIALPLALSALIGLRGIPCGSACPNCSHDTFPLLSRTLHIARSLYGGLTLQRRWCPACEWDGYARAGMPIRHETAPVEITPRRTQELRTLELGGRPWNVKVEFWREHGRVYGRLVFVGPSGKLWCDPTAAFSAATQHEVLSQALSLSDRLLAYRLKEVISG